MNDYSIYFFSDAMRLKSDAEHLVYKEETVEEKEHRLKDMKNTIKNLEKWLSAIKREGAVSQRTTKRKSSRKY